jgi:hypothetical protein
MNAKKVKAIRKMAKQMGVYDPSKPNQYKQMVVKKIAVPTEEPNGKPVIVERITMVSANKHALKQMKKAYNAGELAIYSLKDLHDMKAGA